MMIYREIYQWLATLGKKNNWCEMNATIYKGILSYVYIELFYYIYIYIYDFFEYIVFFNDFFDFFIDFFSFIFFIYFFIDFFRFFTFIFFDFFDFYFDFFIDFFHKKLFYHYMKKKKFEISIKFYVIKVMKFLSYFMIIKSHFIKNIQK